MDIMETNEFWYADLSQELADATKATLGRQSSASFQSTLTYVPWDDIPVVRISCLQYQVIPLSAQNAMIQALGGKEKVTIFDLDSSQTPMLSMPKKCAEILVEVSLTMTTSR